MVSSQSILTAPLFLGISLLCRSSLPVEYSELPPLDNSSLQAKIAHSMGKSFYKNIFKYLGSSQRIKAHRHTQMCILSLCLSQNKLLLVFSKSTGLRSDWKCSGKRISVSWFPRITQMPDEKHLPFQMSEHKQESAQNFLRAQSQAESSPDISEQQNQSSNGAWL